MHINMQIVTSLLNIQMKFYESFLNILHVTAQLNQRPLAVRRTAQRHFYVR